MPFNIINPVNDDEKIRVALCECLCGALDDFMKNNSIKCSDMNMPVIAIDGSMAFMFNMIGCMIDKNLVDAGKVFNGIENQFHEILDNFRKFYTTAAVGQ